MKKKVVSICIVIIIFFQSVTLAVEINKNNEDEESENLDKIIETASVINENELRLNVRNAVVVDRKSNRVILGKQENKRVAMASTTKIMTAIVTVENANLNDEVLVSGKAAGIGGSRLGLKKGDKISVKDLLYGLMLCSGNDAAIAIAEHVAGSEKDFVDMMNKKVDTLNLKNTHFVTPHGLDDPDHYTTAHELAKLTNYAMENEIFSKIVGTINYTVLINGYPKNIKNTNELLGRIEGVKGVKTGFTNNAGRCLVACTKRGDFEIIVVVLGADTKKIRTEDSIKLIEYTYKMYKLTDISNIIYEKIEEWKRINLNRIYIEKMSRYSIVELEIEKVKNSIIPLKERDIDNISVDVYCTYSFEAPVEKDYIMGNVKVKLENEVLETLKIKFKEKIERKNEKEYLLNFLLQFNKIFN